MTPADEDRREEMARAARLVRLEDAVFNRAVPAFLDAVGDKREWLRGELRRNVREHYGHDLLAERDLRRGESEGSKTWASRRLADEVALLDWVAKFNVWVAEETDQ